MCTIAFLNLCFSTWHFKNKCLRHSFIFNTIFFEFRILNALKHWNFSAFLPSSKNKEKEKKNENGSCFIFLRFHSVSTSKSCMCNCIFILKLVPFFFKMCIKGNFNIISIFDYYYFFIFSIHMPLFVNFV